MNRQFDDFRKIADDLARDIGDGIIKPGDRLLPQRDFAHQHGIAASTAGRVYGELRRRGLITGEVGRGSFVRSSQRLAGGALIDLAENSINLELVFPPLGEHAAAIGAMIGDMMLSSDWADALGPVGAIPSEIMQRSVADFLSDGGWQPAPGSICLAGSGKQAIAASMSAVAERGSRVGVEALTYPVIRGIASGLGIELVPLAMDGQGLSLEALEASLARDRLTALYLQPSLHNPTGATMTLSRRAALGRLLERHDLPVIEDGIYRFLVDEAPLASFAPDHVIFIDSLSKRVAPGLSLGMIAAPPRRRASRRRSPMRSGTGCGCRRAFRPGSRDACWRAICPARSSQKGGTMPRADRPSPARHCPGWRSKGIRAPIISGSICLAIGAGRPLLRICCGMVSE